MTIKLIGAVMILLGCGGYGFFLAAASRQEESALRELIYALDYMQCQLQFHMTPLPELLWEAGNQSKKCVGQVLLRLARDLEENLCPEIGICMERTVMTFPDLPEKTADALRLLGASMGRFDAPGQISSLDSVRNHCRTELAKLEHNREPRLRSYQTLGICAGAALVILLM